MMLYNAVDVLPMYGGMKDLEAMVVSNVLSHSSEPYSSLYN